MFTALAIKNFAGSVLSFLWEYKWGILVGTLLAFLWVRGNNYQEKYEQETLAHKQERAAHLVTKIENELTLKQLQADSETALRLAQEESAANYKELIEKTQSIQEKYNERNKDIDATITKLNSSNNSLQQTIAEYTKRNSNSGESSLRDSTNATSLFIISGLLETCSTESIYYANEAAKLSNSVKALQEWGSLVVGGDKELN